MLIMKRTLLIAIATLGASSQAHALAIPISEPGILSLLGLGAVATVLAVRYWRR